VLVVTRHRPAEPAAFVADAEQALRVLAAQPGFRRGELGRSPDDPTAFVLMLRWADAGSQRRGMGAFEAKVALAPVMASADADSGTFEVLLDAADGTVATIPSARSADDGGPWR